MSARKRKEWWRPGPGKSEVWRRYSLRTREGKLDAKNEKDASGTAALDG